MNNDRFDRFVDGAIDFMGDTWREARREFVCGIEYNARTVERNDNLSRAALAMLDGGLSAEQTTAMLQKHWDLRRSEAQPFVWWAQREIGPRQCARPGKNQKKSENCSKVHYSSP